MIEIIIVLILGGILLLLTNKLPQVTPDNFIKKDEEALRVEAQEKQVLDKAEEEIKEESLKIENPKEKTVVDIFPKDEGKNIRSVLQKAALKVREKDFDEALKLYEEALEIDKGSVRAYIGLGIIYIEMNELGKAIESLEKVCSLDPTNASALNNLGLAYYAKGNFKKSIEAYEKSLSLNNKIVHRFVNLALACKEEKSFKKEAESLRAAIRLEEKPEYLSLLAFAYLNLKDSGQAKKTFERILELDPENVEARRELSKIEIQH